MFDFRPSRWYDHQQWDDRYVIAIIIIYPGAPLLSLMR